MSHETPEELKAAKSIQATSPTGTFYRARGAALAFGVEPISGTHVGDFEGWILGP
jgi:hypothetical protein